MKISKGIGFLLKPPSSSLADESLLAFESTLSILILPIPSPMPIPAIPILFCALPGISLLLFGACDEGDNSGAKNEEVGEGKGEVLNDTSGVALFFGDEIIGMGTFFSGDAFSLTCTLLGCADDLPRLLKLK